MRELEFAGHPSPHPPRLPYAGRAGFPLSRAAFIVSIGAHLVAGYVLIQHRWASEPVPPTPAEFFLFELPPPAPEPVAEIVSAPVPAPPVEERVPEPALRAAEVVPPAEVVVEEPPPVAEPAPVEEPAPSAEPAPIEELAPSAEPLPGAEPAPTPAPFIDLEEARRRAAREVVEEGAAASAYMTFSLDDVAPPREKKPDEPERSIFDGIGGSSRGPSVGQLGQSRTKFGHRVASLCNALTGGFSLMGWGSFCGSPDEGGYSGLFPEVRPPYMDLLPECVDTRDSAPALALEAPFPTVKCRLVERAEWAERR